MHGLRSWSFDVWRHLDLDKIFHSRHLLVSGLTYNYSTISRESWLNRPWEEPRDDSDAFYCHHVLPIFPQGIRGHIWVVDFTMPSQRAPTTRTSVDVLNRLFIHMRGKRNMQAPYTMELLRLVRPTATDRANYPKELSPSEVPVAAEIIVRNPVGFRNPTTSHFLDFLISDEYYPRFCPKNELHHSRTPADQRTWNIPSTRLWLMHEDEALNPNKKRLLACRFDVVGRTVHSHADSLIQPVHPAIWLCCL